MELTKGLISVGGSQGVVIPKIILDQWENPETVLLKLFDDHVEVWPVKVAEPAKVG